ncbi:hypothetical protein NVP1166O_21 [Vibrio phage 1.166.O._10N.261.51.C7]|nr:hypothetical protein NVP1166O_21 [Vibrio phage 1.166.O._10N.261.51.C7]AUR94045.1 hypothetical protein NVP1190O_21 [Vibrio phage 1.190.O._10N.286.51.F12]
MPWNGSEWVISTIDQAWQRYYDIAVQQNTFTGTFAEFKQGKYGALYYAAAQQDVRQETELAQIFEKQKDFYRESNALIRTNNLNPQEIQFTFLDRLGLNVALDRNVANWSLAIDYTPTASLNQQIAQLLATECFAYGVPMVGDIVQSHQTAPDKQAFDMHWMQATTQSLEYRLTITTVSDNSEPELTLEEIREIFLENHAERVVWGNTIQPQKIITETDLGFAASVLVEVTRVDADAWQSTPLELVYTEKPVAILDVNNITITPVTPTSTAGA